MSLWNDGSLRGLSPTASSLGTDEVSWQAGEEILAAELETQTAPSGGLQEHLWGI